MHPLPFSCLLLSLSELPVVHYFLERLQGKLLERIWKVLESLCLVLGPCALSWWVAVGLNEQSFPHALYKHAYRVGCFGTVRGFFGHDSDTLCISLVYPTLMMFLLVSKRGSLDRYGSLSRLLWCIAGRLQLRACSTRFWNCF